MTRDTSSLQEAKMLLEVLKRIPLNRKISTTDLHQQLTAAGYELSRRTLQRYLKALSESDMGVQCDDKSKPFGYRRLLNSNDLDRVGLGADGALLLLLAREHLLSLIHIFASGEYNKIYRKWFGTDAPKLPQ